MNDYLQKAYMETTYAIFCEQESFYLKIDISNTRFKDWCTKQKINSWAIITAFNPYSQELTKQENEALNARLRAQLTRDGFGFHEAKGIPNNTDWNAEESFFIHNITLEKAKEIGTFFQQNAIVYGIQDDSKELIWLV